jgi:spore maturation protein CgeB
VSQLKFVFLGLSITSAWGNGHATTYRGLVRELVRRGHDVLFLERDVPYYADNRDLPVPPYGRTELYGSVEELTDRFADEVRRADVVIVGSFVPDGVAVGDWVLETADGVRAFYDIDTPVTLRALRTDGALYIEPRQIPSYDLYLSFAGGPSMTRLSQELGAQHVRALYCSADPESYSPASEPPSWDLGYLGTYSADRQPVLDYLLLAAARRWPAGSFVVAGPQYPDGVCWPRNVERVTHVPPAVHRRFFARQRFTLNLTRRDMLLAGYAPSVRLFEAAACATPIITDAWRGLEQFFDPGREILVARRTDDVLDALTVLSEPERRRIGERGRQRLLAEHTAAHRAEALERYVLEVASSSGPRALAGPAASAGGER